MKKNIILSVTIIILFVAVVYIGWLIFIKSDNKISEPIQEPIIMEDADATEQDKLINDQINEIETIRREQEKSGVVVEEVTEEVIQQQISEITAIQESMEVEPLTEEDIERQLKEIEALQNK